MTEKEQDELVMRARIGAFEQASLHALIEQGQNLIQTLRIIEKMVDTFAANQQVGYLTVGNAGTAKQLEEPTK